MIATLIEIWFAISLVGTLAICVAASGQFYEVNYNNSDGRDSLPEFNFPARIQFLLIPSGLNLTYADPHPLRSLGSVLKR